MEDMVRTGQSEKLIKIREVSVKYDISARALRYYEDMGLIQSSKSEDYSYRLYDENTVKRIEQILILRKLNIKVKDIKRIFDSENSDVVLDILNQKVDNIDEEVALLHELKEIILDFIAQIEKMDFQNNKDVKLLYEKAKSIEGHIVNIDYNGNAATINKFMEVTEKLEKKPDVCVIWLPACKMLSSGISTEPDLFVSGGIIDTFDKVWSNIDKQRKNRYFSNDFMWFDPETQGTVWWYALEDWMPDDDSIDTGEFEVIDFEGGLYAFAVSKDGDHQDGERVMNGIYDWIMESENFEPDDRPNHYPMYHMLNINGAGEALGYEQLMIYRPIKAVKR